MPTLYYGAYDDSMAPVGLFRVVSDDDGETLDTEYMTDQGTWKNDPGVIDELHEINVEPVEASDVPDIVDALTGGQGADELANEPSDEEDDTMPIPGAAPSDSRGA
jgi:hypothetical protein